MKCDTANCDERISDRSSKIYCKTCRNAMYYASTKEPGWATQRAKNLEKYQDRLSNRRHRGLVR